MLVKAFLCFVRLLYNCLGWWFREIVLENRNKWVFRWCFADKMKRKQWAENRVTYKGILSCLLFRWQGCLLFSVLRMRKKMQNKGMKHFCMKQYYWRCQKKIGLKKILKCVLNVVSKNLKLNEMRSEMLILLCFPECVWIWWPVQWNLAGFLRSWHHSPQKLWLQKGKRVFFLCITSFFFNFYFLCAFLEPQFLFFTGVFQRCVFLSPSENALRSILQHPSCAYSNHTHKRFFLIFVFSCL